MGKPAENYLVQLLHLPGDPPGDGRVAMPVNRRVPGGNPVYIGIARLIVQVDACCPADPDHIRMGLVLGQGVPYVFPVAGGEAFRGSCVCHKGMPVLQR